MKLSADARAATDRAANERTVLLALIILMGVNQTAVVIISPLVVDISVTFGVSVAVAAQLRTISALVSAITAPWIGVLSERTGRKPLLLAGIFTIGLSALGSAVAPSFPLLLAAQAVGGLGVAALLSMGFAAVGDYFLPERRSWAMGMVNIGQPLAWVLGLPVIGLLADGFGWRWSFVGVPLLFSLIGVAFAAALPQARSTQASTAVSGRFGAAFRQILSDRSATAWIGAELLAYIGWAGTLTFLGAFYIESFGLSAGAVSPLLALTGLGFVGGSLFAHRVARKHHLQTVILTSAVVSGLFLVTAFGATIALPVATVLLFCFGVSQGVRGATASVLGLQQSVRYRGTIMALRASVVQLGYVIGAIVAGLLLTHGGFPVVGLVGAGMIVIGGILTLLLVQEHPPA